MKHVPRLPAVAATALGLTAAFGLAVRSPSQHPAAVAATARPALASVVVATSPAAVVPSTRPSRPLARRAPRAARAVTATPSVDPSLAPAAAGMVVGIDPETGALGPATLAQRLELAKLSQAERTALSRSDEGLVEVHHPNGAVSVDLQGRFQDIAVIHIDRNGRKTFRCVEDSLEAARALQGEASRPAALEED